jgi:regulator of protease activity HflC (stomatin/prohibitin superfamily)
MHITSLLYGLRRLSLALLLVLPLTALAADQKTFATPDEAVDALFAALKADDDAALLTIFGDKHKDLVVTSDRAANSAMRANAVAAMQTYRLLEEQGKDRRMLLIGDQAWPFPIPLLKTGERWRFATEEGENEIFNRRIGANERNAMAVLEAYLDAQKQYALWDRNNDGVLQYAQRLASTPGKRDGCTGPRISRRARR